MPSQQSPQDVQHLLLVGGELLLRDRIDTELRFVEPWESTSAGYLVTEEAGENQTTVRWGFTGSMARPMNLMLVFTPFEELVAKDFEEGLGNLKRIVEALPGEAETGSETGS